LQEGLWKTHCRSASTAGFSSTPRSTSLCPSLLSGALCLASTEARSVNPRHVRGSHNGGGGGEGLRPHPSPAGVRQGRGVG
jgi:hypothetical protein